MSSLFWTDDLSIGIESIDAQHKILFGFIDHLQEAMSRGESRTVLEEIFLGLVDYTEKHFKVEEAMFKQFDYPDTEAHLVYHVEFEEKMQDLKLQFDDNLNFMIGVDVMQFLTDWLVTHIQGTDKKYAPFLIEKGVK